MRVKQNYRKEFRITTFTCIFCWIFTTIRAQETLEVYKEKCDGLDAMTVSQYAELTAEMINNTLPADQKTEIKEFDCRNIISITRTVCSMLLSPDNKQTLFHTECSTGRYLKSLFQSLQVNHSKMQFESKCIGDASGQEDSIRSRTTDVAELIVDLMDKWGWKKIIVFTDVRVAHVLKDFSSQFVSVVIVRVRTKEEITSYLNKDQLKASVVNHFFIMCNPVNTRMILEVAKELEKLAEPNTWIIMSDVSASDLFEGFPIPYDTFVALASATSFTPSSQQQPAALLLAEPAKGKSKEAILSTCGSFSTDKLQKPETDKPQNTQLANLQPLVVDLSEVYSVGSDKTVLQQDFGRWSSDYRLLMWRPFPNNLRNLNGLHLRITSLHMPPYVMLNDSSGQMEMDGFYGEIFKVLAKEINFTYTIEKVKDGNFGSKVDGKWNGMIAELVEKRADLAVCDISVTNDRKTAVEFSPPLSLAAIKILYRKPDEKFHYKLYILPFDANIWALVLISMLVSGGALHVAGKYSPKSILHQPIEDDKERLKAVHDYSLANCLLAAYNGFVQQGAELEPQEVSGKIIFVTIYLSFVIVFSSYTSIFTSFLTIKDTTLPIEDIKGLLADKSYKIGVHKSTSELTYFQTAAPSTDAGKVWQVIEKDPNNIVSNSQEGTDRAYNMKFALITPAESTIYFLKDKICNFVFARDEVLTETFHFAYQQNFLYKQTFDAYIDRLTESGIIQRIQRRYEGDERQFCGDGSEVKSLGFKRVVSLFMLLGGAGVLAGLFLAYEKLSGTRNRNKRYSGSQNRLMPPTGWAPSTIGQPHPTAPNALILSRPGTEKNLSPFVHQAIEPTHYKGYGQPTIEATNYKGYYFRS